MSLCFHYTTALGMWQFINGKDAAQKKLSSLFLVRHFYFCAPGMITDRNTGECLFYDFTCQKPAKPKQQGCWNQICIVHCRAIYCQSFILLPKSFTISLS